MNSKAAKKAWETRRKKAASRKAYLTGKNAITFTKKKLTPLGWKYAEFKSKKGFPRDGIVDMIAVKIDKKRHDKLRVIFFQVKGGKGNKARPEERQRLQRAVSAARMAYNCVEKPGRTMNFDWEPTEREFVNHSSPRG